MSAQKRQMIAILMQIVKIQLEVIIVHATLGLEEMAKLVMVRRNTKYRQEIKIGKLLYILNIYHGTHWNVNSTPPTPHEKHFKIW